MLLMVRQADIPQDRRVAHFSWADAPTLAAFVAGVPHLSGADRRRIVEQALCLLQGYYVHLPFKRELHDVDPVAALQRLLPQVEAFPDDVAFHSAMCDVFNRLRDFHTAYHLPGPYARHVAFLPFEVGCLGEVGERRYLVTRIHDEVRIPGLVRAAEILSWDGAPVERAVAREAQRGAGANRYAKHARAVEALTLRPLLRNPPPRSDPVAIMLRTPRGREVEIELAWRVCRLIPDPLHHHAEHHPAHRHMSLDHERDAGRQARRQLYGTIRQGALMSRLPSVFSTRILTHRRRHYGYLHISTFKVSEATRFVGELHRLLGKLPQAGLVIDLRGNSGGLVQAAERSLQLLTPHRITPQSFQFLASPQTLTLCQRHEAPADLAAYAKPIRAAIAAGRHWCEGRPMSEPAECNAIGQVYQGPVVLLVDARCYSAADIFIAGFADHAIGHIIGTAASTGAGGANVLSHSALRELTGDSERFAPLPQQGELRVALRRCLRVGPRAGEVLEERGVTPDEEHRVTREDLLNGDRDLLARALSRLSAPPPRPEARRREPPVGAR